MAILKDSHVWYCKHIVFFCFPMFSFVFLTGAFGAHNSTNEI